MSSAPVMLSVNGIEVIYNHVILVLKGVSLSVREGGIVALLGANGAGCSRRRLACLSFEAQPASLAQSRLVTFFSAAYFSAELRIIGFRMLLSACRTPGCTFHFLPSQVWIPPVLPP